MFFRIFVFLFSGGGRKVAGFFEKAPKSAVFATFLRNFYPPDPFLETFGPGVVGFFVGFVFLVTYALFNGRKVAGFSEKDLGWRGGGRQLGPLSRDLDSVSRTGLRVRQ